MINELNGREQISSEYLYLRSKIKNKRRFTRGVQFELAIIVSDITNYL